MWGEGERERGVVQYSTELSVEGGRGELCSIVTFGEVLSIVAWLICLVFIYQFLFFSRCKS